MFHNPTMKVAVFIDSDGTLTGRDGGKTVSDPFYKSLYENPELVFDSPHAKMKDEKTLIGVLKNTFGENKPDYTKKNSDLLITKDAVDFLHTMLKNPEIKVNIISKNRQEYIVALLKYHGFKPEEIAQLTIKPLTLKTKSDKVTAVCIEQSLTDIKPIVYLFDDTQAELEEMLYVIKLVGATENINPHHHAPGNFPWETYTNQIEAHTNTLMSALKNEEKADTITPRDFTTALQEKNLRDFIDDCLTHDLDKIKNETTKKQFHEYLVTVKNMKTIPREDIAPLFLLTHRLLFKAFMPDHANNQENGVNLVMSKTLADDLFRTDMRIDPTRENLWVDMALFFTKKNHGKILKTIHNIMTPETPVTESTLKRTG